jgi:hypothetical protein
MGTPGPHHEDEGFFDWGPIIHSYTRADALRDGELVALPEAICREAGLMVPVAVTRRVWEECIHWPEDERGMQDETGRMWDVLFMGSMAARAKRGTDRVTYQLHVVPRGEDAKDEGMPPMVTLVLHIGPGDNAEPVITVMFPGED